MLFKNKTSFNSKELLFKELVMPIYLLNSTVRLKYVPNIWKVAEAKMLPKPEKLTN